MAWAAPAMGGAFTAPAKPKTTLLDRALNDLGNIGSGLLPGIVELGSAVTHDIGALAPFTPNKFALPGLGKKMGMGMWNESALPPLLLGDPVEAFHRANARPVSALLDLSLLAPASTGIAHGLTLPKSTRAGAFDFLGHKRTTDEFAVGSAMELPDGTSLWDTPAQLPSTIPFADGTHDPMREYFAPGSENFVRRGNELWARKAKRTMSPGAHPVTMLEKELDDSGLPRDDGSRSKDLVSLFQQSQDPLVGGFDTLGSDPWRKYTNPRAESQPFALIGDKVEELRNSIPDDNRFSTSSRIGKRMYRKNELDRLHDTDNERAAHEKALGPLVAALREREEFAGLDEKQLQNIVSQELIRDSFGLNKESLERILPELDPNSRIEGINYEAIKGMTALDLKKAHGLYFDRVNKHTTHELPGDLDVVDHWVQRNAEMLRGEDSPYELKALSNRHYDANEDAFNTRMDSVARMEAALTKSPSVVPILHGPEGEQLIVNAENVNSPDIHGKIFGDEQGWSLTFNNDGAATVGQAMDGDLDPAILDSRTQNLAFRNAVSNYKDVKSKKEAFDEHSKFTVNQRQMLLDPNAPLQPRPGQAPPGIVERLKAIQEGSLEDVELDELAKYKEHMAGLREKSADNVKHWMGEELFSPEAKARNEARGAEWVHGEGSNVEGQFFPMKPEVDTPQGKFLGDRTRDDIQKDPLDKGAGNPFELFLQGKFRTDYKVILDDFEQNRAFSASKKLIEEARSLSMKLTPAQYKKYKGKEITEAKALGENYARGTFVVLNDHGPMAQAIRSNIEGFEKLAAMFAHAPEGAEASAFAREAAEVFRNASPIRNPMDAPLEGAMHDPDVRTALKDAKTFDEPMVEVMPAEMYRSLHAEYMKGQQSLKGTFRLMTDLWKHTVLHMRFAQWMKNNVIGGHLMVIMAGGPKAYLKMQGMRASNPQHFKEIKGKIHENMQDVLASGSSMQARETNLAPEDSFYGQYQRKLINPLSEINAKWADDPVRTIRMMEIMDQQLGLLGKISGKKTSDLTPEQVQKFMDDPVMRDELATRTNTDMVDFSDMSETEKKWLRSIFPFWSWMKGSAKASQRLAADHPGRVWAAGEIADVGEQAVVEDQGTHLPDFARGWWDPGETGGDVIDTSGMNPYGNAMDFMSMGMGLMPDLIPGDASSGASYRQFGSENMLSSMHPFLSGGIESATGKNLFFGTPIENQSVGSGFLNSQVDIPLYNFGKKFWDNKTGPDATTEYHRGQAALGYFLGIPEKDPRWGQVNARGWDEVSERYGNGLASRELAPGWVN